MKEYTLTIQTQSPLCLGSGKADVNVDTEIVHDALGLPYFPGKRLRGLLYESAVEVAEMAAACGMAMVDRQTVEELFHHTESAVRLVVADLHLPGYDRMAQEWAMLQQRYGDVFRPDDVLNAYTSLRFQTAIDEETGIAKDHSLRNIRVLHEGVQFVGTIGIEHGEERHEQALTLAVQNLRRAGLNRNRGFGKITCSLSGQKDSAEAILAKGGTR